MPDAFFSYSRRDGDFVRRLAGALEERGKKVWVDVDGIRDTERFPEALRRAIEASDAFVFVISPDSVCSEFCEQEVAHAAGLNKRIVPLALRQVPDTELPEEIRFRNWIPVDGEDPFEAGVERVVAALETDLVWEHEHSRLTVRALEWERSGRERSFLLRGADLKAAERWLAAGAAKDPGPTALETEYLVAARRATGRRQRSLAIGSAAVAAVAIGLLIFALISRSAAIDQALTSDAERVGGQALSEKNLGLAMLYAVAGVKLQNRLQTRSDLLTVLQNNPTAIKVIRPSREQITALAVNPRGQLLAIGDSAGVVRFEDMSRWERSGGAVQLGGAIAKNAMSFSPRGDTLAVLTQPSPTAGSADVIHAGREKLYVIDVATRKARLLDSWGGAFGGPFEQRASLAYDPRGRDIALVVTTSSSSGLIASQTLRVLDASSGRPVWQRPYPCCGNPQRSPVVGFAAHGALLTSAQQGDTLLWNPHKGRVVRRFSIGGQPAISADGTRVALAINSPTLFTPTSRVAVLDLRTGHSRYLQAELTNWLYTLAFTPDGSRIVGDANGGDVYVWDPLSGGIAQTIAVPQASRGVALLDPTGRTLLVGSDDGSVLAWDMTGKRQLGRAFQWDTPMQSCEFSPCLAVNHRSDLMATDEGDGSVALVDLRTLRRIGTLPAGNGPTAAIFPNPASRALAFLPDGHTLVTGGATGDLTLWDVRSHRVTRTIKLGQPVLWLNPSPSGRLLAVQTQSQQSSSSRIQILPLRGHEPLWTHELQGGNGGNGGVYFSPDGRYVAALGCCTSQSSIVASWSARPGKELFQRRLAYHATTIAYSSDSRLLAVGTETGQVRFWNARSGLSLGPPIHPSTATVSQISFSPDGPLLAVSTQDGNTTLWDVNSRKQVGVSFPSRPAVGTAPVFEPNGRLLIDYLADAAEWPTNVSAWERFACNVAGRNLTQAEWRNILPNRSYMRVCPSTG